MDRLDRLAAWAKDRVLARRGLTEALQTARHRLRYGVDRPVVVVHQMARVGSTTVIRAARQALPRAHVLRTHYLNPATIARHYAHFQHVHRVTGRAGLHRHFLDARMLQARLQGGVGRRWKVVSLVRDPVARTVSAFFRTFPFSFAGLGAPVCETPDDASRLLGLYLGEWAFGHQFALDWFDTEVRDVLGIDVYATPFPRAEGHALHHGRMCDLLVLRLEDLDRCGARALREFLGLQSLALVTANRGDQRDYAGAARRFAAAAALPTWYLDLMYDSPLARHFVQRHGRRRGPGRRGLQDRDLLQRQPVGGNDHRADRDHRQRRRVRGGRRRRRCHHPGEGRPDLIAEIESLKARVDQLEGEVEALGQHTHTYRTGRGEGHNNTEAITGPALVGE